MAQLDKTPVTVIVPRDRLYRAEHEDRLAVEVKGGVPTSVPRWVAEHWGAEIIDTQDAQQTDTAQPWQGYDDMNVQSVVERLDGLSDAERERVRAYETANKNRSTVLSALEE